MTDPKEYKKRQISIDLQGVADEARELALDLGLNPRPVNYWIVDNDEMNQLISYGGFQERYPHWRWGMTYDRQRKQTELGMGKAFEIVNNDTPCHAFLQMSNGLADQKAVITHVEAHSDFFENNQWYANDPEASDMLARHADRIRRYMNDPDIDREEVEEWIDNITCLEDNIDQYSEYVYRSHILNEDMEEGDESEDGVLDLDIDKDIEEMVFGSSNEEEEEPSLKSIEQEYVENTERDILAFLIQNGKQNNETTGRAEEFEEWQIEILDMLREEAYYFAPQKMTKVLNEGWAAYWESIMMTSETFAEDEDIVTYADHMSRVLASPGLNPYSLGLSLWQYVENTVNRREVVDKLLRIDGIEPENFHEDVDFQRVFDVLNHRTDDDIVKRNYSLTRPRNQGFISRINRKELRKINRYLIDTEKYSNIEKALEDVDYEKGWNRMREIRETHNDTMFIDEFLTQEFVDQQQFFTYEYRASRQEMQVASQDVEDVRKKLLLQFTNFGKPTVDVATGNYDNTGELLLIHRYNGVVMNLKKAVDVLERMYEMWGRPVNLATIQKEITEREMDFALSEGVEPQPEESGTRFRYDGVELTEHDLESEIEEEIMAEEVDYNTKPSSWK